MLSIVLTVSFSIILDSRRDNTQTNTCAFILSDFLWYTGLISRNDLIVLNDLSICHCSLYADTTSSSLRSVFVTMRNLPASFFSISILLSLSAVLFSVNFTRDFNFPRDFFSSF
ncbi:MAG: hypothetical protein AMDU4_FER2C00288G0001 [Ferroplasma sp. Type II]|nr:MAG: hypothetical protein AMDU4_FER2C00288G0001 [Ferroplasma sp. Type II]